ncbi:DNA replication terminus site-binding protein [Marinobacter sp. P4B1]|uniref:DNA replication terminus site-binding protein n=1 Tax=Marinobacter sp. P4B1 TaxID=1119533 RepID=UPI00071DA72D|nr:DNA replication terminus site-binding protein [Marinobacter sp. P4B1]KRW83729.1 hypothetical protein AQ621_16905 [Marinobacter sp. P4B1]
MRYSPDQLAAIEEIGRNMEALEALANELCDQIRACTMIAAQASQLPRPKKDAETDLPSHIEPVEHLTGEEALTLALKALTDWYGDGEHSTKAVARTPGVVVLDEGDCRVETIGGLFEQANHIKQTIRDLIPRLGSQDERFRLLHDHHRMLITLQLIRNWTLLPPQPRIQSVTFTWGIKTEIKKVTVDELLAKMKRYLNDPPPDVSLSQWNDAVNTELSHVASLSRSTELRFRRKLIVRPLANIRFRQDTQGTEGQRPPTLLREAHTPIFTFQRPGDAIRIKPIGTYDERLRKQRKPRADRKACEKPVTWLFPVYQI